MIGVSAAVAVFACLGCALASGSFSGLILARALAGACCAASIPLAMAWIGDAVPYEQRHVVLARFMMGQMIGMASGQTVGGYAAEHVWWQWPFVLFAAVFAIAAVLLWRLNTANGAPEPPSIGTRVRTGQALVEVLRRPWSRVVLIATLLEGICFLDAFTFVATHLHHVGGLSLKHAGLILITFSGGGLVFALLSPRWAANLDEAQRVASVPCCRRCRWRRSRSGRSRCRRSSRAFFRDSASTCCTTPSSSTPRKWRRTVAAPR